MLLNLSHGVQFLPSDSLLESPRTSLNLIVLFYGQILPFQNILYLIK